MSRRDLHKPVLREEALESLNIVPDGIYFDGTCGRGGHSGAILSALGDKGRLIATDSDPAAIEYVRDHFGADHRFTIYHDNFAQMKTICEQESVCGEVSGVLLDLGVSSPQLDDAARGFSFSHDGPLDMRMDPTRGQSAREWLANADEKEMADVFWQYGEERYSRRIARALVARRQHQPFENTLDLAEVIKAAHPKWEKNKHPATRVFQAIRIHLNRELEVLKQALTAVIDVLRVGGRLAVISFHSLEDRLVKRFIRGDQQRPQRLRGMPIEAPENFWPLRSVGKAIRPGRAEIDANPRARSAVLRVAEKIA